MKKKLILITLLMFFGCQKPCKVCEDCSWDNELSWALHVEGEECIYTDENDKCSEYFSTIEIEEGGETEKTLQDYRDRFNYAKVRKIVVDDITDRQFILNVVPGGDYEQIFEIGYDYVKYKVAFKDEEKE